MELLDDSRQTTLKLPEDMPISEDEYDAVRAELYHKHLPRLEARGYIRWDKNAREVAKGPRFDEIGPLLELIHDHRDELPERWF